MDAIDSISAIKTAPHTDTQTLRPQSKTVEQFEPFEITDPSLKHNSTNVKAFEEPSETASKKLQSMFIAQLVEEIFKDSSGSIFGEGAQGDYYQSVFSNSIADKLAEKDILGFQKIFDDK